MTNNYFIKNSKNEQKLIQSIIDENIEIAGIDVLYLPRKVLTKDLLLQENYYSQFDKSFWIDMIIKSAGYQNHSYDTNIYGIINNSLTLIVSKNKWAAFSNVLNNKFHDYTELIKRPKEGDLIWVPFLKQLYEIKLVDHEMTFYMLQKLYTYEIQCDLYNYSPEKFNLNIEEYNDYSNDSGLTKTLKVTILSGNRLFEVGEIVVNKSTGETARVVSFDSNGMELNLREVNGNFESGILEGNKSKTVAEITTTNKKTKPKNKIAQNKKLEEITDTFLNNINNPFLK